MDCRHRPAPCLRSLVPARRQATTSCMTAVSICTAATKMTNCGTRLRRFTRTRRPIPRRTRRKPCGSRKEVRLPAPSDWSDRRERAWEWRWRLCGPRAIATSGGAIASPDLSCTAATNQQACRTCRASRRAWHGAGLLGQVSSGCRPVARRARVDRRPPGAVHCPPHSGHWYMPQNEAASGALPCYAHDRTRINEPGVKTPSADQPPDGKSSGGMPTCPIGSTGDWPSSARFFGPEFARIEVETGNRPTANL